MLFPTPNTSLFVFRNNAKSFVALISNISFNLPFPSPLNTYSNLTSFSSVLATPNCPDVFNPAPYTSWFPVKTYAFTYAACTFIPFSISPIFFGRVLFSFLSNMWSVYPHVYTFPSLSNAKTTLCSDVPLDASISIMFSKYPVPVVFFTFIAKLFSVFPCPNCPLLFNPHAYTSPSFVSAYPVFKPCAIFITLFKYPPSIVLTF